jgi:hypothetical protein
MNFESYKGINYVRISSLPLEEQVLIHKTLDNTKIIKILRERELLKDCVQTHHYKEWKGIAAQSNELKPATAAPLVSELRLAFK